MAATVQLVLFDLDGTLAPINRQVEAPIVCALRQLEDRGIRVGLISGKPLLYLAGVARQMGLINAVLAGENGAVIHLSAEVPPSVELPLKVDADDRQLLDDLRREAQAKYPDAWMQPNQVGVTLFSGDPAKRSSIAVFFREWVANRKIEQRFCVYLHADAVEVVPCYTDKGQALLRIAGALAISPNRIAVVGDGENDLPMFREAGLSIGIGCDGATYRVADIQEALQLIEVESGFKDAMKLEGIKWRDKDLWQIEYEQVCEDWRHRDVMLWQSVAVSVAVTGAAFSLLFNKDFDPGQAVWNYASFSWFTRQMAVLLLAAFFDLLMLVKIVKDHYYQCGSSELLVRLGMPQDEKDKSFRIYRPHGNFWIAAPRCFGYMSLTKISAFRFFFYFQLALTCFLAFSLFSCFLSPLPPPKTSGLESPLYTKADGNTARNVSVTNGEDKYSDHNCNCHCDQHVEYEMSSGIGKDSNQTKKDSCPNQTKQSITEKTKKPCRSN